MTARVCVAVILIALAAGLWVALLAAPASIACTTDLDCACQSLDAVDDGRPDYASGARDAVRAGVLTCPRK